MNKLAKTLICLILLTLAVVTAKILIFTAPKAEKKKPPKQATLVDIVPLQSATETVRLHLTGTVIPAQEITLQARVSGEIESIHPNFVEGGLLKKGETILTIDPTDFELALAQAESAAEKARFDYTLERGRQDVAKREWELLAMDKEATELEKELALRTPHLRASKAALQAAEAALKRAQLNLERTQLHAPFNAVVLSRNVNVGSQSSASLARLVGTDHYWIQASIPVDRLQWITIPGSKAHLQASSGAEREGTVIRLLGDLEQKGRMARILIEVDDPLSQLPENETVSPLLLDEYVRVEVEGRALENTFRIPRSALRENDRVWIAATNDTLDLRSVNVRWRGTSDVLIGPELKNGEQLILSDIPTPMQGLALNTGKNAKKPNSKAPHANPAHK